MVIKKLQTKAKKTINTPALVVMQWLSYAFWAGLIIAIAYLTSMVIGFYTNTGAGQYPELVAYGVVAVAILLPLSILTDKLYGRHEDTHKSVATSVVLVVHSVLFALTAIGGLITTAFLSVNLLISATPSATAAADISTAAVVFVLFGGLLLRVTRPTLHRFLRTGFRIDLTIISLVAVGFAIAGPVGYAVTTKSDRQIRDSLFFISNTLNTYVSQDNPLPDNLETGLSDEQTRLYVDNNVYTTALRLYSERTIQYTPNTQPATTENDEYSGKKVTYFYELCATFTRALREDVSFGYPVIADAAGYSDYIPLDAVQPGRNCYKLKAIAYK